MDGWSWIWLTKIKVTSWWTSLIFAIPLKDSKQKPPKGWYFFQMVILKTIVLPIGIQTHTPNDQQHWCVMNSTTRIQPWGCWGCSREDIPGLWFSPWESILYHLPCVQHTIKLYSSLPSAQTKKFSNITTMFPTNKDHSRQKNDAKQQKISNLLVLTSIQIHAENCRKNQQNHCKIEYHYTAAWEEKKNGRLLTHLLLARGLLWKIKMF